jgi:hypothetical protein
VSLFHPGWVVDARKPYSPVVLFSTCVLVPCRIGGLQATEGLLLLVYSFSTRRFVPGEALLKFKFSPTEEVNSQNI